MPFYVLAVKQKKKKRAKDDNLKLVI
ncbi:hypothetical protein BAPKO_0169 [Borreliella afzelii PKo]|nr:hypothetical protein BAPKO_0169 [Borreliella afzelii PKo]